MATAERVIEKDGSAEDLAAAFAQPASQGELVPYASPTQISTTDGVITAQKVAVERQVGKVLQNIKMMAGAAGDDWYYRFPVKNRDGSTDWIEGPSIKCANNVARMYGNCQIDTRVVDTGDSWIIYARFVDYETGFSYTRPFQQRKGQRAMNTKDPGRALDIALQIGVSKAIRNVVCNSLETFTTYAFDEAKRNIVEKVGKRLEEYRAKVLARLVELKVDLKRVETAMGRTAKEWLAPDVARLIAQLQAIADGMATADETWPGDAPARPTRDDFKEGTAGAEEKKPEDKPKPPAEEMEFTAEDGEVRTFAAATDWTKAFVDRLEAKGLSTAQRDGIWETNSPLLARLRELGADGEKLAADVTAANEARLKAQTEATKPADQPATDWPALYQQLLEGAREQRTKPEMTDYEAANARDFAALRKGDAKLADKLDGEMKAILGARAAA